MVGRNTPTVRAVKAERPGAFRSAEGTRREATGVCRVRLNLSPLSSTGDRAGQRAGRGVPAPWSSMRQEVRMVIEYSWPRPPGLPSAAPGDRSVDGREARRLSLRLHRLG